MSEIHWLTKSGLIATVAEEDYFEFNLDAFSDVGNPLSFNLISGKLPGGLALTKDGVIRGIPVIESAEIKKGDYTESFAIRVTDKLTNKIADRTFTITVNAIALPHIYPSNMTLGTYYDGYYFSRQLVATDPNPLAELTWTVVSGTLPNGVVLEKNGLLHGYIYPFTPTYIGLQIGWNLGPWDLAPWDTPSLITSSKNYIFQIQVFDGVNYDKSNYNLDVIAKALFTVDNTQINVGIDTLDVSIDNLHVPFISTTPQALPTHRQNSSFAFKVDGIDLDKDDITFTMNEPFPVELITIPGFLSYPIYLPINTTIPLTVIKNIAVEKLIDFTIEPIHAKITFLTDPGVSTFTLNKNIILNTTAGIFTYDIDRSIDPYIDFSVIKNITLQSGIDYVTKLSAKEITFMVDPGISNYTLLQLDDLSTLVSQTPSLQNLNSINMLPTTPPGLTIDPATGWITGEIGSIRNAEQIYVFQVGCYKTFKSGHVSTPVTLSLTVLGEVGNTIDWVTPDILGQINNGEISKFLVEANSALGKTLTYRLGKVGHLPAGLTFLSSGLIIGRVSFQHFNLDRGLTTFDKNTSYFDNIFTFSVIATSIDGTVSSEKTFTIQIHNFNIIPYENVYMKSLPAKEKRIAFAELMNDQSIFPDQFIYRLADPWFGKAADIKFLFAAGLTPSSAASYIAAMQNNTYNKTINIGAIKTAIAVDTNFKTKYEVVYLEVIDTNYDGGLVSPMSIDRTNQVSAPYNVEPYTTIYPDGFDNMYANITSVGQSNRGALPEWMLSPQSSGRVLGFTRGIVLCYTIPGASSLVAYRLQSKYATFNDLSFEADRYVLDQVQSNNFDISTGLFYPKTVTTFDVPPPTWMPNTRYNKHETILYNEIVYECNVAEFTSESIFSPTNFIEIGPYIQTSEFLAGDRNYVAPEVGNTYLKFPKTTTYGPEIF
jgi:hypothetical protein